MRQICLALILCICPSVVVAQTGVSFVASPNHTTLYPDGQSYVTRYELRVTGAAASIANLGKPAPNSSNVIIVDTLRTFFDALPFGSYQAVVAAIGPGGAGVSAPTSFTRGVTLVPPTLVPPLPPGQPQIIDVSGQVWTTQGIGGSQGDAVFVGDRLIIQSVAGNTWNTSDSFWFVHQPHAGNGEILARVEHVDFTHSKAKGGVEIREHLGPGSRVVQVNAIADGRVELLHRATDNGNMVQQIRHTVGFPMWVRLVRAGNVFTASYSQDGVTWTTLGTTTNEMSTSTYAGALHAAIQGAGSTALTRLLRR